MSQEFEDIGHSNSARETLEDYVIGKLDQDTSNKKTAEKGTSEQMAADTGTLTETTGIMEAIGNLLKSCNIL